MNPKKKIAIALSGGIDSAFCACFLSRQGYELVGVTLKMPFFSEDNIKRAGHVCKKLRIPHHVIDVSDEFSNCIVEYFINSYLRGLTPNPCCLCNRLIKFGILLEKIQALGCSLLATGHYAGIIKDKGETYLAKGKAGVKSQEYFLGAVPKEKLKYVLFPLENFTKEEVRRELKISGIYPFRALESREICFIKEKKYKEFIEERVDDFQKYSGFIKHWDGRTLGKHKGIYAFTYGQREGLGVSWQEPLYVVDINPESKEVLVAERERVLKDKIVVKDVNWFYPPDSYLNLEVKMRYNSRLLSCAIENLDSGRICCVLKEARVIPAPGQLAVFYDKERVVAGGWIARGTGA